MNPYYQDGSSEPLTDEQLADIETLYRFDVGARMMPKTWELSIGRLLQEVRRLRELSEETA